MRKFYDVDEQGKLRSLLERVRDDESHKVDFMANTTDLQFNACTSSHASQVPGPRIIAESKGGMPTKTFIVNDVCLDQITIDAQKNTIIVDISDKEIKVRKAKWTKPPYKFEQGVLYKYIKSVATASEGCVTDS